MKRTRQPDQLPVEPDIPAPETAIDEAGVGIFRAGALRPDPADRPRVRIPAHRVAGACDRRRFPRVCHGIRGDPWLDGLVGHRFGRRVAGKTADATSADGKVAGEAHVSDRSEDGKGAPVDSEPSADEPKPADGKAPDAEKPGTEPAPAPEIRAIDLDVALGDGGRVRLEWGACAVDGFAAWKIVRSTDAGASFPLGGRDTLVAAFKAQGKSAFTDAGAPKGKKLWYAVFGLTVDGEARHVACRSRSRAIVMPAPGTKPTERPAATTSPALGLTLAVKEGVIYIDFSECEAAGAEYYKVVRSSDSTVKWPAGESDALVAAVGMDGKTSRAWDKDAPSGKKAWYRVFCVRHAEEGYKVLASSAAKGITAPVKDPAPEPKAMWIEVSTDGGKTVVHWEACGGERFSHYRMLRKTGEGTTVVAEIESAGATTWVDETVEAGGTYKYLVQSKGVDRGVVRPPRFDRLGSRDGRVEPRRTDDRSMDASRGPAADGTAGQWPGRPSIRTI